MYIAQMPYLKFTLEEEFLLEQVLTASSFITNEANTEVMKRLPAQSLQVIGPIEILIMLRGIQLAHVQRY
jgi:hypothetical protein